MSVKTVLPENNMSASSARGPSEVIWSDCPVALLQEKPGQGMYVFDDFLGTPPSTTSAAYAGPVGKWAVYADQTSVFADGAKEGGVLSMSHATQHKGITFGGATGWARLVTTSTLALNQKLWFEARVAASVITTSDADLFVGLFDGFLSSGLPQAAWPISVTPGTLASTVNALGFMRLGTVGSDWQFVYQLNGSTMVAATNLTTLATTALGAALTAGQYVKLGFLFDPNAVLNRISSASTGQTAGNTRQKLIRIFVNGVELPAFLTSDNLGGAAFPTGSMAPGFAIMTTGGSPTGAMLMDWIGCAQIANS